MNVSRTGVLFQPHGNAPAQSAGIEFVLELPGAGNRRSCIECRGKVARCCGDKGAPSAIAATIDSYRFLGPCAGAAR